MHGARPKTQILRSATVRISYHNERMPYVGTRRQGRVYASQRLKDRRECLPLRRRLPLRAPLDLLPRRHRATASLKTSSGLTTSHSPRNPPSSRSTTGMCPPLVGTCPNTATPLLLTRPTAHPIPLHL